jgi:hypothetical protein
VIPYWDFAVYLCSPPAWSDVFLYHWLPKCEPLTLLASSW